MEQSVLLLSAVADSQCITTEAVRFQFQAHAASLHNSAIITGLCWLVTALSHWPLTSFRSCKTVWYLLFPL